MNQSKNEELITLDSAELSLDTEPSIQLSAEDVLELMSDVTDLDLDASLLDEDALELDAGADSPDITFEDETPSTVVIDMHKVMQQYVPLVRGGVGLAEPPQKDEGAVPLFLDYIDFQYLTEEEFNVLSSIVSDVVNDVNNDEVPVDELISGIQDKLVDTTGSTSCMMNEEDFYRELSAIIPKFRGLRKAATSAKQESSDFSVLLDKNLIKFTERFLKVNVEWCDLLLLTLRDAGALVQTPAFRAESRLMLDASLFGKGLTHYLRNVQNCTGSYILGDKTCWHTRQNGDQLLVHMHVLYDALTSLLGITTPVTPDGVEGVPEMGLVPTRLGIGFDQLQEVSMAEQLRRLILLELQEGGQLCGTARDLKKAKMPFEDNVEKLSEYNSPMKEFLRKAIMKGPLGLSSNTSLAAELLLIILLLADVLGGRVTSTVSGIEMPRVFALDYSLTAFFRAAHDNLAFVTPTFYNRVVIEKDNATTLHFGFADKDYKETSTRGLLCDVVGDNGTVHFVPYAFPVDKVCTLLPPPALVEQLRSNSASRIARCKGRVYFTFTPTVDWLNEHSVVDKAENFAAPVQAPVKGKLRSPLLQILDDYENEFDLSEGEEDLKLTSLTVGRYAITGIVKDESTVDVCLAEIEENGGKIIAATKGTIVLDGEYASGAMATPHNELIEIHEEYTREEVTVEDVTATTVHDGVDLSNFFICSGVPDCEEGTRADLHNAVVAVCVMTAVDYEEEVRKAREALGGALGYVFAFGFDNALRSKAMMEHIKVFRSADIAQHDKDINIAAFRDIVDILTGNVPTWLEQATTCDDAFIANLSTLNCAVTLEEVVQRMYTEYNPLLVLHDTETVSFADDYFVWDPESKISAMHFIPEMDKALQWVEDTFVLYSVFRQVGDRARKIVRQHHELHTFDGDVFTAGTIDDLARRLCKGSNMKAAAREKAVPLSKALISTTHTHADSSHKYFILRGDAIGLLKSLEADEEKSELLKQLLASIGRALENGRVPEFTTDERNEYFSEEASAIFFQKNRELLKPIVFAGLCADAMGRESGTMAAMASDAFSHGYDQLTLACMDGEAADLRELNSKKSKKDFLALATSYLLSYAPITAAAQVELDTVGDRAKVLRTEGSALLVDVPGVNFFAEGVVDILTEDSTEGADNE